MSFFYVKDRTLLHFWHFPTVLKTDYKLFLWVRILTSIKTSDSCEMDMFYCSLYCGMFVFKLKCEAFSIYFRANQYNFCYIMVYLEKSFAVYFNDITAFLTC